MEAYSIQRVKPCMITDFPNPYTDDENSQPWKSYVNTVDLRLILFFRRSEYIKPGFEIVSLILFSKIKSGHGRRVVEGMEE